MRKFRFLKPVGFLIVVSGFSAIIMLLWNWLMPDIFGLVTISFWQALGLFALSHLLFGHPRLGWHGMKHRMGESPMHRKWKSMTPEQREAFISKRRKFGFGPSFGNDFFTEEKQASGKKDE